MNKNHRIKQIKNTINTNPNTNLRTIRKNKKTQTLSIHINPNMRQKINTQKIQLKLHYCSFGGGWLSTKRDRWQAKL